ncbi:hypothetical protein [Vibrio crassostreae]|uniref:hypothetical protein n=1 Tax=Vibrio crassostreae TaxID=246167 RepID=UPI001B301A07|nr:hypothetical protein [Vibrio crassostreae]
MADDNYTQEVSSRWLVKGEKGEDGSAKKLSITAVVFDIGEGFDRTRAFYRILDILSSVPHLNVVEVPKLIVSESSKKDWRMQKESETPFEFDKKHTLVMQFADELVNRKIAVYNDTEISNAKLLRVFKSYISEHKGKEVLTDSSVVFCESINELKAEVHRNPSVAALAMLRTENFYRFAENEEDREDPYLVLKRDLPFTQVFTTIDKKDAKRSSEDGKIRHYDASLKSVTPIRVSLREALVKSMLHSKQLSPIFCGSLVADQERTLLHFSRRTNKKKVYINYLSHKGTEVLEMGCLKFLKGDAASVRQEILDLVARSLSLTPRDFLLKAELVDEMLRELDFTKDYALMDSLTKSVAFIGLTGGYVVPARASVDENDRAMRDRCEVEFDTAPLLRLYAKGSMHHQAMEMALAGRDTVTYKKLGELLSQLIELKPEFSSCKLGLRNHMRLVQFLFIKLGIKTETTPCYPNYSNLDARTFDAIDEFGGYDTSVSIKGLQALGFLSDKEIKAYRTSAMFEYYAATFSRLKAYNKLNETLHESDLEGLSKSKDGFTSTKDQLGLILKCLHLMGVEADEPEIQAEILEKRTLCILRDVALFSKDKNSAKKAKAIKTTLMEVCGFELPEDLIKHKVERVNGVKAEGGYYDVVKTMLWLNDGDDYAVPLELNPDTSLARFSSIRRLFYKEDKPEIRTMLAGQVGCYFIRGSSVSGDNISTNPVFIKLLNEVFRAELNKERLEK